jgi:dTMP kinase
MFVVFEGIDGSGKTTISNLVAQRLKAGGLSVKHLRAEGKFVSAVSEAIRDLGRDARNLELVPQAEFLLYVARDVQLIEQALRPALRDHDVVLADRFLFTAETLAHHGRHLAAEWIAPVLAAAAGGLSPDLVVLVDVDPALARARRKAAKLAASDQRPPSRKGLAGVGLQHRLRRGYLALASASPDRWVVVDNEEGLDDIVATLSDLVGVARRIGTKAALAQFRAAGKGAAAGRPRTSLASADEALAAFLGRIDHRAEREPGVAAYLLGGLYGPSVDERRRALAERVPKAVLAGMVGLSDETSWALRGELAAEHPRSVAHTLTKVHGPRASALRSSLEAEAPAEVAFSLDGLDDEASWAARERLFANHPDQVVGSLSRIGSERAWDLRDRWISELPDRLGAAYPSSMAGSRSVTGLAGDRAWHVRDKARAAAPVAALASLEGVTCERSWQWREQHLPRAPKVVMATLRGLRDERSWQLRHAVESDCKEALDSIVWLDDEEAWGMRERLADTWPSTVVKTLGPLSREARGQALVQRQLGVHPDNLSLLKHAAAAALGCYGGTDAPEGGE